MRIQEFKSRYSSGILLASGLFFLPLTASALEAKPAAPTEKDEPAKEDKGKSDAEEASSDAPVTAEQVNAMLERSLTFQTGEISLRDGLATLRLREGERYLDPEQSQFVLEEVWGNPPRPPSLGMILPAKTNFVGEKSWAVVIDYEEEGYVEDDDAESIDYDELLEQMQEGTRESNEARRAAGYPELALVGWAEPPHYDSTAKKLYWAKELAVVAPEEARGEASLNYDIRILGRRGVLVVTAVAGMSELAAVRPSMKDILGSISFQEGSRYQDFDPDMDKVAAYGIGALVAGKLASKAGLLAGLGILLLKAKKLVIVALVAIGAVLTKVFSKKTEEVRLKTAAR